MFLCVFYDDWSLQCNIRTSTVGQYTVTCVCYMMLVYVLLSLCVCVCVCRCVLQRLPLECVGLPSRAAEAESGQGQRGAAALPAGATNSTGEPQ